MSVSGGLDMGRERLQTTDKNNYLGEDSQNRPLEDLMNRYMDAINQSQAEQNLTWGGAGYGGSFLPGNDPRRGGGGGGGGGNGGGGPVDPNGYPIIPGGPGAIGGGRGPLPGRYHYQYPDGGGGGGIHTPLTGTQYGGQDAANGDNRMFESQNLTAYGNDTADQDNGGDGGGGGTGGGGGGGTGGNGGGGGGGSYGGGDPYGAGNQNTPWRRDPTGMYYYQADPLHRNENDEGRQSPVTPQGSNFNDAWSTSPAWRPEAPTGGIYGASQNLMGGDITGQNLATEHGYEGLGTPGAEDTDFYGKAKGFQSGPYANEGDIEGVYKGMIAHGWTPEEENAIGTQAQLATRAGFGAAQDAAMQRASASGNRSGAYAALASLGQSQGGALGEQARQSKIAAIQEAERRKEAGAAGLQDVGALRQQRESQGLGMLGNYANELARRKEAGLGGMERYGNEIQRRKEAGINALSALNQQAAARTAGYLNALGNIASLGREHYTMLGKTTGQGGINVGGG